MHAWLKRGLFAALTGMMMHFAYAIDVVKSTAPKVIEDNQITIGDRTLNLPAGNWTYTALGKGAITVNGVPVASTYRAYAIDAKEGIFRNGLELELPFNSATASNWAPDPCKVEGHIFKDDFDSGFRMPECLVIYRRDVKATPPALNFFAHAMKAGPNEKWVLPRFVYEVNYTRFGSNEFGKLIVWLPAADASGDEVAVAWAKNLPGLMRRFFERRETEAGLVMFPVNAANGLVASVSATPVVVSRAVPSPVVPALKASGFASIDDVDAIPYISDKGRERYREWLTKPTPRAFAISDTGVAASSFGLKHADESLPSDPTERVIVSCNRVSKTPCRLYAINGSVVWVK